MLKDLRVLLGFGLTLRKERNLRGKGFMGIKKIVVMASRMLEGGLLLPICYPQRISRLFQTANPLILLKPENGIEPSTY